MADEPLRLERRASLLNLNNRLRAELGLGAIPVNEQVEVEVELVNDTDEPFDISSISTSCTCSSAKTKDHRIKPGESGKLLITFESSKSATKPNESFSVEIHKESGLTVRLVADYSISGFLKFSFHRNVAELSFRGDTATIGIPLQFTRPVVLDELKLKSSFPAKSWEVRSSDGDGQAVAWLTLTKAGFAQFPKTSRVKISSPDAGTSAETLLVLAEKKEIKLFPSQLIFKLNDDATRAVATAVVSVSQDNFTVTDPKSSAREEKKATSEPRSPIIDARIGDRVFRTAAQPISKGRYRIKIDAPKDIFEELNSDRIVVNVGTKNSSQIFNVPFVMFLD